ncbi:MAG TPA: alkaline phosphatase family protein [Planctomycetota bacterium]|jgi:predicted AlkP superfamily phosphohydrolase/phosphomutase
MPQKVAVLGLDCADPKLVFEQFRPQLPVLSKLMDSGMWGRLRSTDPPITCPAWMVMVTGTSPGELGIYGFRNRTDHSYGGLGIATSSWIKHETVWDVLSRVNRKCITYAVPLTFPPKPLNGCQVGCFLTPGQDSNYTFPMSLRDEMTKATGPYVPDVPGFRTNDKVSLLKRVYEMTDSHTAQVKWLLKNKPWDFFMMVEMGVDRIHHGFWKYFDTTHPRYEANPQLKSCMQDYYRHVDASLGKILEDIPDDAWVAVVSDHGIKSMVGGIAFNEWLIQQGYLVLKTRPEKQTPIGKCDIDWAKTRAWGDGGYYGRLFLNIKGREPQGVIPPEQVESFKQELSAKIKALCDDKGKLIQDTKVLRPEDLYDQVNGIAPDLIVYFGGLYWRSVGSVGGPNPQIHTFENDSGPDDANHAEDGIFILSTKARMKSGARGPGQRSGLHIRSVAKTVLKLQGVEPPAGMGGAAFDLSGLL